MQYNIEFQQTIRTNQAVGHSSFQSCTTMWMAGQTSEWYVEIYSEWWLLSLFPYPCVPAPKPFYTIKHYLFMECSTVLITSWHSQALENLVFFTYLIFSQVAMHSVAHHVLWASDFCFLGPSYWIPIHSFKTFVPAMDMWLSWNSYSLRHLLS